MNKDAQRIAIAEAMGYKVVPLRPPGTYGFTINDGPLAGVMFWGSGPPPTILNMTQFLPDYLSDLNAVHEAEKVLEAQPSLWREYGIQLQEVLRFWCVGVVEDYPRHLRVLATIAHATAAQRCEALLRTLILWVEAAPQSPATTTGEGVKR